MTKRLIIEGLNERLKQLRKEAGLSQEELAEALGLRKGTVGDIERRTFSPRLITLIAYADFFDLSIDFLLGREGYY